MGLPDLRILLFIDQFEEIFTQSSDLSDETGQQQAKQQQAEATRQIFLQSLADAVHNALNFVLVFTIRNDFISTLQGDRSNSDFNELLTKYGLQSLGKITGDRRRSIVTKPVKQLNVKFEDGLVDRLLQDVGDGAGTLPLLQLVLNKLWDNQEPRLLTNAGYKKICGNKGVKAILAERAEEIYGEFVEPNKAKQFREVFFNLVSLGDGLTGTTRRIATLTEIGEKNWREIVVPLSKSETRLLKTDADEKTKEATVEILHESLIEHWRRLKNWIDEYSDELERIAEIKAAAMKWDKNNRSKQDLWQGKKLNEAKKFSKAPGRVIDVGSIVNEFLVAGLRQQRWNRGSFVALGLIVPGIVIGVVARNYIIESSIARINSVPKNKCDNNRLSTAFQSLKMVRYELKSLDLQQRDLHCVNLMDIDFNGANLSRANLSGANLSRANLNNTSLNNTNLSRANLSGANLNNASLSGAHHSEVNLNGLLSEFYEGFTDLRGANLSRANLSGANLYGANLSGADLSRANLSDVNLSGADLSRANLSDVNLSGADLFATNLSSVFLRNANLRNANLSGANLSRTDLVSADLSGAYLWGTNLRGANLVVTNLTNADLLSTDLLGAIGLDLKQVKLAKNWEKAKYDSKFRKKLGLK
jgi:uncharacterized protein YjbI with pentapeptide repeats